MAVLFTNLETDDAFRINQDSHPLPKMAGKAIALLGLLQLAAAIPAPRPAVVREAELALITPTPTLAVYGSGKLKERGLISDITAAAESDIASILTGLGSNLPTWFASGIIPQLEGLPTGTAVLNSAGLSSSDLDAVPTSILNIPGYGNWTNIGWNLRIHGNVYKQPNISESKIDELANGFVIGSTSVSNLPPAESAQAGNLTREIYVVQQNNVNVTVNIVPAPSAGSSGQEGGGGGITPPGGNQIVTLPDPTTPEGDFDSFIQLQNISGGGLLPGNTTGPPQRLNVYAGNGTDGNATSYLVPTEGMTIISDIDDTLRVTKIWSPAEGLNNTFVYPFRQWTDMPSIYANWSTSLPNTHFHYLTTTPEQITKNYMQFVLDTYPGGSFDTRPLNFSDVSATLAIRKFLLDKIFQTFPQRKFILVGDTSNSDVMKDYPGLATQYPNQVQCIFLRNVSSTDPTDKFPYDTSGFKNLNQQTYMFFHTSDDLLNLDIVNGQCYNASVKQNVTFDYQGLPLGLSNSNVSSGTRTAGSMWTILGSGLLAIIGMIAFL